MRRPVVASAAVSLSVLVGAAGVPDPLAPARDGKLQCYQPNVARKTCGALASYSILGGGKISNPSSVLVASDGNVIIMKSTTIVEMRGNAVCGMVDRRTVDQATFTVDGRAASAYETARLRVQMAAAMAANFGKEICTTYERRGAGFVAQSTIGGLPRPDTSQDVIWVGQGDGYTVAP
jgi:hypothetical protein